MTPSFSKIGQFFRLFPLYITLTTIVMGTAGCVLPVDALTKWTDYPQLWGQANNTPRWLVLKCAFSDVPAVRELPGNLSKAIPDLDTYIGFQLSIMGGGSGNLIDYFYDVTYGGTLLQTEVHGWFNAPYASNSKLSRAQRVEQCASAVPASEGIDFSQWDGIIIVTNKSQDGGAAYTGKGTLTIGGNRYNMGAIVFDPGSLFTAFAGHEMGHGFGFQHSFDNSGATCADNAQPGEYCDKFDMMSAMVTWQFHNDNYPGEGAEAGRNTPGLFSGGAGPGMNLPNLLQLNGIPPNRIAVYSMGDVVQTYTISALSHAASGNPLGVRIVDGNFADKYTVEYRQADGWDAGFPVSGVLIHSYVPGGSPSSILIEGPTQGAWVKGGLYIDSLLNITVFVTDINTVAGTATININTFR